MAGWADAPGATDQEREDARTAIAIIRKLMTIYGHPGMLARYDTFTEEEISLMLKLGGSE
jgi:hypothetical protein